MPEVVAAPDVEGFILAGGASSRMGTDKARLRLGGETFVARAARALSGLTTLTRVVSSRAGGEEFGLPVVADVYEAAGALGGLHAALAACRAGWAAVVSCDLPFVTAELFARLAGLRAAGIEAVVPVQADGRPQPLCALYARSPALAVAERLLAAGERRPRALAAQLRTRWVGHGELADLGGARLFFLNVNTPAEYERARAYAGESSGE